MNRAVHRVRRLWPLLAAVLWLAATAWMRPLALPDEGRYVGVAWEMLRGGDWLTPHLDGLPYFHKPPLFYWITAASLGAFGRHEWAARLAPLAGAALAAAALYLFARRWRGEREARFALLAFATQPLVFFGAQFANLDMLVAGCIAACVLALAHAVLDPAGGRRALAAAYLFAALGVLAKGLIGAALPALVIVAWLLSIGRWRAIGRLLWWPGMLLFLAVAAPWFLAMESVFPDFLHYFFGVQHFARFAGHGFNNAQPWWFYPAVLAVLALPWTWWALRAARGRAGDPQADAAGDGAARALGRLPWVWIACITLFFSLPESKLVGYILPVAPAVALLAASVMTREAWPGRARTAAALAGLFCVGAAVAFTVAPQKSARPLAQALAARMQPDDTLLFLGTYPFDLPFYAGLQRPVAVVDQWAAVDKGPDNWRKELADAGRFTPEAAARLLVDAPRVDGCGPGAVWLVGTVAERERWPQLRAAQPVAAAGDVVLWRAPRAALTQADCAGMPSANSAGM